MFVQTFMAIHPQIVQMFQCDQSRESYPCLVKNCNFKGMKGSLIVERFYRHIYLKDSSSHEAKGPVSADTYQNCDFSLK